MLQAIAPLSGWALDIVVAIDRHASGFAGHVFRASDERRQVIAAYLAAAPLDPDDVAQVRTVAELLCDADHRTIIQSAYSTVPVGLRGALARSGAQPHERRFYERLYKSLARRPHREFIQTIAQLATLDHDRLRIAHLLPRELCRPNVVTSIGGPKEAHDVVALYELLISNGADRKALANAVRKVASRKALARVWKRWSRRSTFDFHPVPASADYTPIIAAADLRRAALRYHNCAERYVVDCLNGLDAFAEFRRGGKALIVHLRRREDDWFIEGMFGKHNGTPPVDLCEKASQYLGANNVRSKPPRESRSGPWDVLDRLVSPYRLDWDEA